MRPRSVSLLFICALAVAPALAATTTAAIFADSPLDGSEVEDNDGFGFSVAASGNTIVVGSLRDQEKGELAGAAYVFERNGAQWQEVAKLTGSDLDGEDLFGRAVAIDKNVIVVAAPVEDSAAANAGALYVFERRANGKWKQTAKLIAADAIAEEAMGWAVAIHNKRIAVGLPGFPGDGLTAGRVLVFRKRASGWKVEGEVVAADGQIDDGFGFSVAIRGKTLIVGAPFKDGAGAAYAFRKTGGNWVQEAKMEPDSLEDGASFGSAVATNGRLAAAGAYRHRISPTETGGAVFVYGRQTARGAVDWTPSAPFAASDGGAWFGGALAMAGNRLAVGARLGSGNGGTSGAAYQFRYRKKTGTWMEQGKHVPSDGTTSGQAGFSVGIGKGFLVFGAPGADPGGRAYVADL